jgi:hypothetical protein
MSYPNQSGDSPFSPKGSVATAPNPYEKPAYPGEPPPTSSGNGCMWGCIIAGIVAFVLLLICAGGVYYAVSNAKSIMVNLVRSVAVQAVEGSELSAEDKQQVIAQIDRVVEAYKKGEINEKDLENILKEVSESPILPLAVVYGLEKQYLDKSGLNAEEKADARKQIQRLMRGAIEDAPGGGKKIPQNQIDAIMQPLQQTGPNGEKQLKPTLTDQEIKTFVAEAKKLADDAMIPDEEFKIDIGDEVKRIVDEGLTKGGH